MKVGRLFPSIPRRKMVGRKAQPSGTSDVELCLSDDVGIDRVNSTSRLACYRRSSRVAAIRCDGLGAGSTGVVSSAEPAVIESQRSARRRSLPELVVVKPKGVALTRPRTMRFAVAPVGTALQVSGTLAAFSAASSPADSGTWKFMATLPLRGASLRDDAEYLPEPLVNSRKTPACSDLVSVMTQSVDALQQIKLQFLR